MAILGAFVASFVLAVDDSPCREQRQVFGTLAKGTIEEVWTVLESGDVETPPDCRELALVALSRAVSRTDDVRIAARVLEELTFAGEPSLEPVLRAGLAHSSAQVRRHAARAVIRAQDPALTPAIEERFEVEADEGVRRDLIRAMAATGSRRFLPKVRRLAAADASSPTRRVARRALLSAPDPESVPLLEAIGLSEEDEDLGLTSRLVKTLAEWRDVPGTNAALRTIGRRGPSDAAAAAIRALGARDYADTDALAEIAAVRAGAGDHTLEKEALDLIEILENREHSVFTFSCGATYSARPLPLASGNSDDFDGPTELFAAPRAGAASTRCWDAPGFVWPGVLHDRLPSGTPVEVIDEFSWSGENWNAVVSVPAVCWLRASDLAEGKAPQAEEGTAVELDLTMQDAQSWAARALEQRGWLSWLESDEMLVAVRFDADRTDRETIRALVAIREQSDSPAVALALGRWLHQHADEFEDDPEFGELIPENDPRWALEDE